MVEKLADATIQQMIHLVNPEWELREVVPAERGFCSVYRITVETTASTKNYFLKAPPDGATSGISADARILTVLRTHTSIPVPAVVGVVDDHPEVPSPFYLMDSMAGTEVPYEKVGWVSDTVLQTVAQQTGAYLGELHTIDAVESFGYVDYDKSRGLTGGRPSGTVTELNVVDGFDSWQAYLNVRVEHELERHETSQFSALTSELESWCQKRIENITGTFSPVLGRNDHGFHNLLIDPDTGDITAMLDWAYTLAVTPAYDFHFAEYLFSGTFLSAIQDVPDRREVVRNAMLSGYRSTAPQLADAVSTHQPLYEMMAMVRIMNDFDMLTPKLPDGCEEVVADGLRKDAESILEMDSKR